MSPSVGTFRPSRPLPFTLDELRIHAAPARRRADAWGAFFRGLDVALHSASHRGLWRSRPGRAVRRAAPRRCGEWIIARQERDGCRGGIQPPWVYSLIALHLLGYRLDDTAEIILALRRVYLAGQERPAIDRATRWLAGMQSRDGGWGAFDADNTRHIVTRLPFCDFGAVIDPPSADVTAHIIEALAAEGLARSEPVRRGVVWLLRAQEPDGSWFGRWAANYLYGTGAVVPALIAAGVRPSKPPIRRAVAWLEAHQNPDSGWGEDLRSYDNPADAGRGESTASQTAWALLALLAAGERTSTATERGVRWLVDTQRADGTWDEPWFTGVGFPRDFYINYHMYRLAFPLSALGRYLGSDERSRPAARLALDRAPAPR